MINEGENWNRSHSQLIYFNNMNVSLLNNNGIPLSNDPFIHGLAQHISNYNQSHPKNNQNLEAGFNEFVLPLIHFAKDFSNDPRSVFLMQLLQESKKAFLETKNLRQNAVKELEDVTTELQKDIVKLIEIIDEIKNKA
jgi:hypothetical protein